MDLGRIFWEVHFSPPAKCDNVIYFMTLHSWKGIVNPIVLSCEGVKDKEGSRIKETPPVKGHWSLFQMRTLGEKEQFVQGHMPGTDMIVEEEKLSHLFQHVKDTSRGLLSLAHHPFFFPVKQTQRPLSFPKSELQTNQIPSSTTVLPVYLSSDGTPRDGTPHDGSPTSTNNQEYGPQKGSQV
ncbi:hypothetical protein STEG23_020920 [Scotinomys teguina]